MSDVDTEAVLGDLLKELGVEGVTLWHIRALAAHMHAVEVYPTARDFRLDSDLRGEEAVKRDAWEFDTERAARLRVQRKSRMRRTAAEVSALYCDHHPNTDCARCR